MDHKDWNKNHKHTKVDSKNHYVYIKKVQTSAKMAPLTPQGQFLFFFFSHHISASSTLAIWIQILLVAVRLIGCYLHFGFDSPWNVFFTKLYHRKSYLRSNIWMRHKKQIWHIKEKMKKLEQTFLVIPDNFRNEELPMDNYCWL